MFKRLATSIMLVAMLSLALAVPVLAGDPPWQAEGGTLTCPYNMKGQITAKYNDIAIVTPPGGLDISFNEDDGRWHIRTRLGVLGGGVWQATGSPLLDLPGTYVQCVYP